MTISFLPMAGAVGMFSLNNTNFVVLIAFVIFVGILLYLKVPAKLSEVLDARATAIQAQLDEARSLREEAQTILASFERKQREVADQAESIVTAARIEAESAAEQAKEDLKLSIERRLQAAIDQIASAEQSAVKEVKDTAVSVAINAATNVISANLGTAASNTMIDEAIKDVAAKLH